MANSVDTDQTAPRSSLIWAYIVFSDLPVTIHKILMVVTDFCCYLNNINKKMLQYYENRTAGSSEKFSGL